MPRKAPTPDHYNTYSMVRGSFKRIDQYTDAELDAVIAVVGYEEESAYKLLNFIDCYFERRNRKLAAQNMK